MLQTPRDHNRRWVVGLVALTAIHSAAGSAYSDNFQLPHTQSFDAIRLLERNAPRASGETDQLVIAVDHGKVTDPAVRARAEALFDKVAQLPHVSTVGSPYAPARRAPDLAVGPGRVRECDFR